jgi:hypothetical protein
VTIRPLRAIRRTLAALAARLTSRAHHQPLDHCNIMTLLRHLCDFNDEKALYVLRWLAYPLRHPGAKMDIALVVNGERGTGKRLFFQQVVAALYGKAAYVRPAVRPLATYSNWPAGVRLVVLRGVFSKWNATRLKELAAAKALLTNDEGIIYPQVNRLNIVFLSDSPEFLPVLDSDPRLFVLEVPPPMPGCWYAAIADEIKHGGIDAFRHFLLHDLDMGDFNEHTRPPGSPLHRAIGDIASRATKAYHGQATAITQGQPIQPPAPPPARVVCDSCGVLPPSGEHKGWLCRLAMLLRQLSPQTNPAAGGRDDEGEATDTAAGARVPGAARAGAHATAGAGRGTAAARLGADQG